MDFTTNCHQIPIFFKTVQKERTLHEEQHKTLPIYQESLLKYYPQRSLSNNNV